jgi:hypothetical protein
MEAAVALDYPNGLIGTTIEGRYKVEAVLAQGGMGTVFRATHLTLSRPVALKILRPDLESDQTQRFLREANIVAQLEHRNCVTVFDHGRSQEGLHFMAMQLLKGHVLSRATGTAMDPIRACMIIADVLRGLEHAHARNVVHRDLKPENLFVTTDEDGQEVIKLLDFGIAKFKQPADSADGAVTLSGLMAGTPAYMSPEQVIGADTDERTDLYSAGVILYELLAGHTPFNTDDPVVLLHHQLNEEFPPLANTVPATLHEIVRKMCDKEKAKRYGSASEALADVEAFLFDVTDGEIAASSSSTRRWQTGAHMPQPSIARVRNQETMAGIAAVPESRGRPWWHWGVAAGFVLLAAGVAVPMLTSDSGTNASAASGATLAAAAAEVAGPDGVAAQVAPTAMASKADRSGFLSLLAKVNDPDYPLPFEARQQSLEALRSSDYSDKIDWKLQTALDLVQAAESRTACQTFRDALSKVVESKDAYYAPFVSGAEVPDPGSAETAADCKGLEGMLSGARRTLGTESAEPAAVQKVAQVTRSSKRRASKRKSRPRNSDKPATPKIDDTPVAEPTPVVEPPKQKPKKVEKSTPSIGKLNDGLKGM